MATQLKLNLLIDTRMRRVLLAEAGKDFVDFLFSLLAMPVGSVTKLLTEEKMVGSMGSVYASVESLDDTYVQSNQSKSVLLNPIPTTAKSNALFLIEGSPTPTAINYYRCASGCGGYCSDVSGTKCPYCNHNMAAAMHYVSPQSGTVSANAATGESSGFVKGGETYIVMDDLSVMPMSSAISYIMLLKKFNVKDVSSLEERTVNIGMEEGLELLRVSLQSKTVLTDVFLVKTTTTTTRVAFFGVQKAVSHACRTRKLIILGILFIFSLCLFSKVFSHA